MNTYNDKNIICENVTEGKRRCCFPDNTPISEWFYDITVPELCSLGKQYVLNEHGIYDDGRVYTKEIQKLIDEAASLGGGVIIVPKGTYITGSLYFKDNVNLYISEGGILKGSDNIYDYGISTTRIEGETCKYIDALINIDRTEGFTMCGSGTIDGNGMKSWKAFWMRREWNPDCTNKDEQRARLIYISNSKDITIANIKLINSQFWTCHLYKCNHIRFLNCYIYSPAAPVKAPSTDAIDIDVCTDVLVKNCYIEVNDDAIALKGGKGPWADKTDDNGSNERIIIEDCTYGFCHGCLTCGSESIYNRNIILRRIKVLDGFNLLWLKIRPDTPQHYEYITVENITGKVENFLQIRPWTQFFDLKDRKDIPLSNINNVIMKRCCCHCKTFLNVESAPSQYRLSDFTLEDLKIQADNNEIVEDIIDNLIIKNVSLRFC